jgi:hypothetical protein
LPQPQAKDWELITTQTMYDGDVTYKSLWGYWARTRQICSQTSVSEMSCKYVPIPVTNSGPFFYDYENPSYDIFRLIHDACAPINPLEDPATPEDVWNRISNVWNWWGKNVQDDYSAYDALWDHSHMWPSILDYALHYKAHLGFGVQPKLIVAACFSKAHLFATLLGRVIPRWHTLIAETHASPPTPPMKYHDYVGVYVRDRWFYLDPTAITPPASTPFQLPDFEHRRSVGEPAFTQVDYRHPFSAIPVPGSDLASVPLLSFSPLVKD